MNFTYFAHAGHEHIENVVAEKQSGNALIFLAVAVVVAVGLIVGSMIYDSKRKSK
jgi:hypothetical protein